MNRLTAAENCAQYSRVGAHSPTGFETPKTKAHKRPMTLRRFFHASESACRSFNGGQYVRGAWPQPVPLSGVSTRVLSATPFETGVVDSTTKEFTIMFASVLSFPAARSEAAL